MDNIKMFSTSSIHKELAATLKLSKVSCNDESDSYKSLLKALDERYAFLLKEERRRYEKADGFSKFFGMW